MRLPTTGKGHAGIVVLGLSWKHQCAELPLRLRRAPLRLRLRLEPEERLRELRLREGPEERLRLEGVGGGEGPGGDGPGGDGPGGEGPGGDGPALGAHLPSSSWQSPPHEPPFFVHFLQFFACLPLPQSTRPGGLGDDRRRGGPGDERRRGGPGDERRRGGDGVGEGDLPPPAHLIADKRPWKASSAVGKIWFAGGANPSWRPFFGRNSYVYPYAPLDVEKSGNTPDAKYNNSSPVP